MKTRTVNINGRYYKVQKWVHRIQHTKNNYRGWEVRRVIKNTPYHSRFFSDKKYGGVKKALDAAHQHNETTAVNYPDKTCKLINRARIPALCFCKKGAQIYAQYQLTISTPFYYRQRFQELTRYLGNIQSINITKARNAYAELFAISAWQKFDSDRKGYPVRFDPDNFDLDKWREHFPCDTRFITQHYILDEWSKRNHDAKQRL